MKLYNTMTADEQLKYVTDLTEFADVKLPRLQQLKTNGWATADRKDMEDGLHLLEAFQFTHDYVRRTLYSGDYSRRVYRLRYYIDKIKQEVGRNMTITSSGGQTFAYIPAMQQAFRRRGRPTKEEAAAMARAAAGAVTTDTETRKQQAIARLLGAEIVTNQTLREKNNDELAEERQARQEAYDKQNPSLFTPEKSSETATPTEQPDTQAPNISSLSPDAMPHLSQLRILLSPTLQERVDQVRLLRQQASSAAEQAKQMALRGESAEAIEPFTRDAADYTEQYEAIYGDVDQELAAVYYRLKNDGTYSENFCKKHRIKDLTVIIKQLKPYFQKLDSPEFVLRMNTIIEQESPEYVAKVKAEQAVKEEVDGIIKYLKRQDKPATDKRIKGMQEKYARLVELRGEDFAKVYLPFIDKAKEDNVKLNEEKAAKKA